MTPEEKRLRAFQFISGSNPGIRFGSFGVPKITPVAGIVPKRTIPQQVVEKISTQPESQLTQEQVSVAPKVVSSLGRVTLDFEIINNNLDRITEIIKEDFKQTREVNKKEVEEYRKRVANRGRVVSKKEFGDRKTDLAGLIKKYVGSFFSGTGGAIRALAGLNILEGIMTGNPMKILGGLTGITASYLPAIGMAVGGKLVQSMFKGGARATGGLARGARPLSGLARGGGRLALGAGLLTAAGVIGSKIFGGGGQADKVNEMISPKQESAGGADILMPADLLKKFDEINKKFEQAVDRLLSGGGPGPGPGPGQGGLSQEVTSAVSDPKVRAFLDVLAKPESGGAYNVSVGGKTFSDYSKHPEMYNASLGSDAAGRYQFLSTTYNPIARRLGLKDFSPQSQDIVAVQYLKDLGVLDEIQSGDPRQIQSAIDRLKSNIWTGLQKYKAGEALKYFQTRLAAGGSPAAPTATPPMPVLPAPSASRSRAALSSPPLRSGPTIVPVPTGEQSTSQTSSSVSNNDVVPSINTTYSENFLALYSKLTYQIV